MQLILKRGRKTVTYSTPKELSPEQGEELKTAIKYLNA
jgi:hypothetical protein